MEKLGDVEVVVCPKELRVRLLALPVPIVPALVPHRIGGVGVASEIVRD